MSIHRVLVQSSRGSAAARANVHSRSPLVIDFCQTGNPLDQTGGVAVKTYFAIYQVLDGIVRAIADEGLWVDCQPRLPLRA